MDFLNSGRAVVRHANMHIGFAQHLPDFAAALASQCHHDQITLVGGLNSGQHIAGIAAGGDGQQNIAGLTQGPHLFGKNLVEVVVVGDRGQDGAVGLQGNRAEFRSFAFKTSYKLCGKVLRICG